MTFKFAPWEDKYDFPQLPKLDIKDPPCKHCKHWKPQVRYYQNKDGLHFDSVRLCWKVDYNDGHMQADFSCFNLKEE